MATLGIDIGCISVKIAVVGGPEEREIFSALAKDATVAGTPLFHEPVAEGRILPHADAPPLLVTAYRRIKGGPADAARELLTQVLEALPEGMITAVGVTGTGGRLVGTLLDIPYENEFKAIARAIGALHPDVTTVFEMGGETSKFIHLETDEVSGRVGIADYGTNGDCAAGTGSFMDQQANRLLYDIEDVGDIVRERRQSRIHRRALLGVRQIRHDPRPAEGLPAPRGAQGSLQRRGAQLPRHHHQRQGDRRPGGLHRRRGGKQGRGRRFARSVRDERRAAHGPGLLRLDGRHRQRPDRRRRADRRGDGHHRPHPSRARAKRPTSRPPTPSPWTGSSCCATA